MPPPALRAEMIDGHLGQLRAAFGRARRPVSMGRYRALHRKGRFVEMVKLARAQLGVSASLRLDYVGAGGEVQAPAWVRMPDPLPPEGSGEYHALTLTIFLRRNFVESAPADILTGILAHELGHILLGTRLRELRFVEEAVDLTAMWFGYGKIYGGIARRQSAEGLVGYLTAEEVRYAVNEIYGRSPLGVFSRISPLSYIVSAFVVLGLIAALAGLIVQ